MSAATAKRRRRQAVQGYNHIARIGRGNNNRPFFPHHSTDTLERRELAFRERRAAMQSRLASSKRKR